MSKNHSLGGACRESAGAAFRYRRVSGSAFRPFFGTRGGPAGQCRRHHAAVGAECPVRHQFAQRHRARRRRNQCGRRHRRARRREDQSGRGGCDLDADHGRHGGPKADHPAGHDGGAGRLCLVADDRDLGSHRAARHSASDDVVRRPDHRARLQEYLSGGRQGLRDRQGAVRIYRRHRAGGGRQNRKDRHHV